jgi:hypothetical protein
MADNQTSVLAAFEMLLEEIENEVELVNRAGGKAFTESDYERVTTAAAQGKRLEDFRARVANMRREWRELMTEFDVEESEDEEVAAQRRDLGRLERGVRTPEDAFRIPILETLVEMGGAGKTADVLDRVGEILKGELKDVDYEPLPSSGMLRWRNTTQWARNAMVNEGLMKDDSPRGVWEIDEAGRAYLEGQEK